MRYAITNLSESGAPGAGGRLALFRTQLRRWAMGGVTHVQLREKTLDAGELFALARAARQELALVPQPHRPLLLINGRADIAASAAADGVHLTGQPGQLSPQQARSVLRAAGLPCSCISVSAHRAAEAAAAAHRGADLVLFGPVFGKTLGGSLVVEATGLEELHAACLQAAPVPVLALGGVTLETEAVCRSAGAAGVAGIRLFSPHVEPDGQGRPEAPEIT